MDKGRILAQSFKDSERSLKSAGLTGSEQTPVEAINR
jgi:hypothetical protein